MGSELVWVRMEVTRSAYYSGSARSTPHHLGLPTTSESAKSAESACPPPTTTTTRAYPRCRATRAPSRQFMCGTGMERGPLRRRRETKA